MDKPLYTVGIDPAAAKPMWAAVYDGKKVLDIIPIEEHFKKDGQKFIEHIRTKLKMIKKMYGMGGLLCVENSFMERNVQVFRSLTQAIERITVAAEWEEMRWTLLLPSTWRSLMGIKQGRRKRVEVKKDGMMLARKIPGAISLMENYMRCSDSIDPVDISESICISVAGWKNAQSV